MFLKHRKTGHLIEVAEVAELTNPCHEDIAGYEHFGEEVQGREQWRKHELQFTSGEALPECWVDPHYADDTMVTSRPWPTAEAEGYYGA